MQVRISRAIRRGKCGDVFSSRDPCSKWVADGVVDKIKVRAVRRIKIVGFVACCLNELCHAVKPVVRPRA